MQNLFIEKHGLGDLVEWVEPILSDTNWLFVTLDSDRGDFLLVREFLTPKLRADPTTFWWGTEGLWLPGRELLNPFPASSFLVSFCAAYIFPSTVKHSLRPKFNQTTDQGEFSDSELREASHEIEKLKAKAYVADGCGLQCLFADNELYQIVQQRKI